MKLYEEPKISPVESPVSESVETHPAYGMIGASRVSGNARLFGSDFKHQHFITIRIHKAELHRGLSRDWAHARNQLIEVSLSEAQWATFVSSMNVGFGVQCTIENTQVDGELPGIAGAVQRKSQFSAELAQTMQGAQEALDALEKNILESSLGMRAKEALRKECEQVRRRIGGSVQFVADQFSEHMEDITEHAKIEVNAYATNLLQRAGLQSVGVSPVQMITDESGERDDLGTP
jgi:hypothetical protein